MTMYSMCIGSKSPLRPLTSERDVHVVADVREDGSGDLREEAVQLQDLRGRLRGERGLHLDLQVAEGERRETVNWE